MTGVITYKGLGAFPIQCYASSREISLWRLIDSSSMMNNEKPQPSTLCASPRREAAPLLFHPIDQECCHSFDGHREGGHFGDWMLGSWY